MTRKGFLKQHTAQIQKIAADPKKKAQFDKFMAKIGEGVEEARSSASDQAQQLALKVARVSLSKIKNPSHETFASR